jgi:hypothetical protein
MKAIIVLCLSMPIGASCEPIAEFLQDLLRDNEVEIAAVLEKDCAAMCKGAKLVPGDQTNLDTLLPVLFLHSLLTTDAALNCARGGVLRTAYFWHWVSPNPRYELVRLPDSVHLNTLPPPQGYERYKTYADIDRLPTLYLSDLVTPQPAYYHPSCGSFHTFGWCSEREMAFCALLSSMGYRCKIKQDGIHVWTEVLIGLRVSTGATEPFTLAVDNTFDQLALTRLSVSAEQWRQDIGSGAQVQWYNRKALSANEVASVASIEVGEAAAARLHAVVREWLDRR